MSLPLKLTATVKEISSPLIFPSEMGLSPCLPETVPVSLLPSTLKLKVVSRVWPPRPGTCATHFPFRSAAQANVAIAHIATQAEIKVVLNLIRRSSLKICRILWFLLPDGRCLVAILILESFAGRTPGAFHKQGADRHSPGDISALLAQTLRLASHCFSLAWNHPSPAVSTCKISTPKGHTSTDPSLLQTQPDGTRLQVFTKVGRYCKDFRNLGISVSSHWSAN